MAAIESVKLVNKKGMSVELINFGARVKSILFPVGGEAQEMVLGYNKVDDYLSDECYLGAICGRVTGRINGGRLVINDELFQLDKNLDGHCHHGGFGNIAKQFWTIDYASKTDSFVRLTICSGDGDQGFPGKVIISASYSLDDSNQLAIALEAKVDRVTPINLTNHTYFTLGEERVHALDLAVNATQFLEQTDVGIPTGNFVNTSELGYSLKQGVNLESILTASSYPQIAKEQGLDHCFVLDENSTPLPSAQLISKRHGIQLDVFTDQPSILIYTAKYLTPPFVPYGGICMECQGYTDAVSQLHFPSVMVKPDEIYQKTITFQFASL